MRLRWQLTLSHLAAVAVTLVSMIAAVVLLFTLVIFPRFNPRDQQFAYARSVAASLETLFGQANGDELNGALRALANTSPQTPGASSRFGPPQRFGSPAFGAPNVAYLALVGPGGHEVASSDASGAAFAPPERGEWAPLAASALAGDTNASDLVPTRSGAGPAELVAYPVTNSAGQPSAAVIVALDSVPPGVPRFGFAQALAFVGAASVFVLLAASLFALASSSLVAYLLSRRVVRRLERLGHAAEALAGGDLDLRLHDQRPDELGQLARRFDEMAAGLQRSLDEVKEERDRVTGLLKARRELVASVSHELRTPVATVRGYLESALLRGRDLPDQLRTDLETAEAEIGRLQRLIDDLFTLSRAEVGRLELRLEPADVGDIARQAVDTLSPLAWSQYRVQLVADIAAGLPAARTDAERLQQVLSNLLSNAIRHTPPGGLVAVSAATHEGHLRLEVRDTGAGIAAEDMPRIFERFYRGHHESGEGAGLGLAVARELVEAMGGAIEVSSVPGEGSCFAVTLPAAAASAAAAGNPAS